MKSCVIGSRWKVLTGSKLASCLHLDKTSHLRVKDLNPTLPLEFLGFQLGLPHFQWLCTREDYGLTYWLLNTLTASGQLPAPGYSE